MSMSVYADLPIGLDQIRLVTVSPPVNDQETDPIHCSLEVASLTDESPTSHYYALSHTWGAPAEYGKFKTMTGELNYPIICQGETLWITQNLGAFLIRLRKTSWLAGKKFWIDVICINQHDMDEKSSQVKLMGHIFSSARNVIMWLGEEDEYTGTAFKALERISECVQSNSLSEIPAYLRAGEDQLKLDHLSDRDAWLSVAKLFQRCYFIRSWTIQEVILGREVKMICGGERIDWDIVVITSKFCSQTGWKAFLDDLSIEYPAEVPLPSYNHAPTMLNATRMDRSQRHWTTTLLYALERSRDFKATYARDKVYCLLGLVEGFTKEKPRLNPVYGSQTAAMTYVNAAIQLLEDGQDLYLLSCIEGELFQQVEGLPSWVPDWTCGKSTGLLVAGYKRYSASGTLTQRPQIDPSALTLSLRGFKVDEVTMVGEAKHQVLDGQPFPRWLEIVTSLPRCYREVPGDAGGEHRVEVFWRTILRNTTGRPPKLIPPSSLQLQSSFGKWLQDRVKSGCKQREDSKGEDLKSLVDELLEPSDFWAASVELKETDHPEGINFETRLSWAKHLRLFRTRSGYLGLGSECVQEGDSVWIIPSSRVPLIFRPVRKVGEEGKRWRLVGGTYLHGAMNGELVCPCCSGRSEDELQTLSETIVIE